MHTLTVLLLSRTKLTDSGMPFIAGSSLIYGYVNIVEYDNLCMYFRAEERTGAQFG